MRFSSRQDLIEWVRDHAPTPSLRHALDRAEVTVWGLFEGGFVVQVGKFFLGVRPHREKIGEWVCGFLSGVPWKSYIGGSTPLTWGDHPTEAGERKKRNMNKQKAIEIAGKYGTTDGAHHKMWVIDQMIRALTDCPVVITAGISSNGGSYKYESQGQSDEYKKVIAGFCNGEDGPNTYEWDTGIAP